MADRISYRNLLVGVYEYYQTQMLNSLVANQPKTHLQTITNQMKTKNINYGDIRLNNIRKYLDLFPGYVRSEMQKKFHESFLQAVALHLYRDDPEVLNCYNVLFYNHCIELTPFFFLLQVDMDKIKRNNEWSWVICFFLFISFEYVY